MQTKLRTNVLEPNENISFPIGTIFLVSRLYEILNFPDVFGKHKTRGIDINGLLQALISYKLADNFSIKRSHAWINRPEVLAEFNHPSFSERTLYRVLETLGVNREEIISDIQDVLFARYDFEHTNINMDWTSIVLRCFRSFNFDPPGSSKTDPAYYPFCLLADEFFDDPRWRKLVHWDTVFLEILSSLATRRLDP
ncbi:MAG: hypothetical protein WAO36_07575 [Candidatus Methanoculleus thermohydrogenotrophicum]|jgi:transposase|nr:hypothetical protein [Candidatus Methanoculleus thermohydrogenotrophicum]